jgi:glycosyltransferase involved in cell wall biosynthesis
VRPEPLVLLGEIAEKVGDIENAHRWYQAASNVEHVPSSYDIEDLALTGERLGRLYRERHPTFSDDGFISRFLIIVPMRNAVKTIKRCLESIWRQERPFRCIAIDDFSDDGTWDRLRELSKDMRDSAGKSLLVRSNMNRRGSLNNIVSAVREYGAPGDVVAIVDGDDYLLPSALSRVDREYTRRGAWMTYGNFETTSGRRNWMAPYPQTSVKTSAFRSFNWRASHLKTFRKELFDKVRPESFLDTDGEPYRVAGDVALMLPLLEMAGERAMFIPDTIYMYDDATGQNEHVVDPEGQVKTRDRIYALPRYTKLEKL